MSKSNPVPTLVTYRPKTGKNKELQDLIAKHWPVLDNLGLVTKERPKLWTCTDKESGAISFVEVFEWKDEEAPDIAHQSPEVMAVWETMGPFIEEMKLARIEPFG